ncbi:hypothetical protein [Nocardia sp. NPDC004711]
MSNIGDSYRDYLLTVLREGNNPEYIEPDDLPRPVPSMYSDFAAAVRTGGEPLCPGREAAVVAEVIDRMYAAAAHVESMVR